MIQINHSENTPNFFLITKEYIIGTPKAIAASDKTIDMYFKDLTENYDLLCKLHLLSAVLIKPAWNLPLAHPKEGQELVEHAAYYLASFSNDPKKEQRQEYLTNNGLVRILISDDKLLEEIKKLK